MKPFTFCLLLLSWATFAHAAGPAVETSTYYRAYKAEKEAPAIRARLAQLEKTLAIVEAPAAITAPEWVEAPHPFTYEMRRVHNSLWLEVLLLIDARGTVKRCIVLGATDEQVAREGGGALAHAQYKPALLGGTAVPAAALIWIDGAGM